MLFLFSFLLYTTVLGPWTTSERIYDYGTLRTVLVLQYVKDVFSFYALINDVIKMISWKMKGWSDWLMMIDSMIDSFIRLMIDWLIRFIHSILVLYSTDSIRFDFRFDDSIHSHSRPCEKRSGFKKRDYSLTLSTCKKKNHSRPRNDIEQRPKSHGLHGPVFGSTKLQACCLLACRQQDWR